MLKRGGAFLAGLLSGLLAAGVLLLLISEPRGEPIRLLPPPTPGPLSVHVSGAVGSPGVYQLQQGSIVEDAVSAAGGALAGARLEAVNLAQRLEEGQQIFIPSAQAAASAGQPAAMDAPAPAPAGKINVNTASAAELDQLPGIGPSLAQAIIEYREAHGPFAEVEDLLNVPGIGPAKLEQMQEWVVVR